MGFPKEFVWGAAAASYQIEGSTQGIDGCGESVWDMCCRRPDFVKDGCTGFVACDHYNRYKEDVAIMKDMGLKAYRLSIMWPRVMPQGTGAINLKGLEFYDSLIDELKAAGIEPWVTLFHWDYPHELFRRGGWLNDDSSDWFADYTQVIVDRLSDRVSNWFTLNEPACFIQLGHWDGTHAPGIKLPVRDVNRAWHNSLLAHGKAVLTIRARSKSPCRVGAAPVFASSIPFTDSAADIEAARNFTFQIKHKPCCWSATWWLEPALTGVYPQDGMEVAGEDAPPVKPGDMEIIHQPLDFLGFNCYSSASIKAGTDGNPEVVPYPADYPRTDMAWAVTPNSLYYGVKFLYERYKLPIIITENGLGFTDWVAVDGKVHDGGRIDFLTRYLRAFKKASDSGIPLLGYFQWSVMDNFEWAEGYHKRFGLVHIDYASQKRTPKDSAYWYKDVIASNGQILGDDPLENWRLPADFAKNLR